ncbi:MAG: hypothetical protein Q9224_004661 [Gallowayella concinna]
MSDDNSKSEGKKGKTGPIGVDEQFKFLIACIRHGVNGKINFDEVVKECSIVSKGAAAKRYERLMKAHDISPQAHPNPSDNSVTATKRKIGTAKESNTAAAKKRKAMESDNVSNNGDEEEPTGKKKKYKVEKKSEAKVDVKNEEKEESPGAGSGP